MNECLIGARKGVQLLSMWKTNLALQPGQVCECGRDPVNTRRYSIYGSTHEPMNQPMNKPSKVPTDCRDYRGAPSEHLITGVVIVDMNWNVVFVVCAMILKSYI